MNQNGTMINLGGPGPGPGGQGPAISGKFFHKDTGKEIFVRDSINDGVKMCVVLSDGTTMDMSEFQNYVQMSDEEYDSQGRLIGKAKEQPKSNLDPDLLFAGMGDKPKESNKQSEEIRSVMKQIEEPNTVEYSEDDQKLAMIKKILDKSSEPEIVVTINWQNKPEKEFEMLKNFFDVNTEDIANAVFRQYGDVNKIKQAFKERCKNCFKTS